MDQVEIVRTFAEGLYSFWCTVREKDAGLFVCMITFSSNPVLGPLKTENHEMDGVFATAAIAMGAGEQYGRAMIRDHGDVVSYLLTHLSPKE